MRYPVGKDRDEYLKKWYIASGFNERRSATYLHEGIDLNRIEGGDSDLSEPIYAVADYVLRYYHVTKHVNQNAYGIHFVYEIQTSAGPRWIHCEHVQANPPILSKQSGKEGDVIAYVGKTGTAVAHLHLAVYKVDPAAIGGIDVVVGDVATLNDWWIDPVKFFDQLAAGGNMSTMYKGLDLTNQDSMKVAVDVWDEVINKQLYLKKSEVFARYEVASLEELDAKIAGLKSRATDLGNQLGKLQAEVDNKLEIISRLQSELLTAQTDNKTLYTRLDDAAKTIEQLGKDKGTLAIEVAQLKQQIETLKQAPAEGSVTITLADLIKLILNQKLTIKRG